MVICAKALYNGVWIRILAGCYGCILECCGDADWVVSLLCAGRDRLGDCRFKGRQRSPLVPSPPPLWSDSARAKRAYVRYQLGLRAVMRTYFSFILCVLFCFSVEGSTISLTNEAAQIRISFTGTLQSAVSVTGTWTDITNVTSPFVVDRSSAHKFFRSRDRASIFSSEGIVSFTVTGPLQEHFDLAYAGMPDGIFPPIREKP